MKKWLLVVGDVYGDLMKCVKCKFKDKKTDLCTYPFKATATGDTKFGKEGNIIGCTHGKKK